MWGDVLQYLEIFLFSQQHLRVVLCGFKLKLFSEDARKVAGSATYKQSQTE